MAKQQPGFGSLVRIGFGLGLGSIGALVLFTLLGLLFFVPGFIILNREQKKPKEEQSQSMKIFAFVLMGLGVIMGVGLGAGTFLGEIGEEL